MSASGIALCLGCKHCKRSANSRAKLLGSNYVVYLAAVASLSCRRALLFPLVLKLLAALLANSVVPYKRNARLGESTLISASGSA